MSSLSKKYNDYIAPEAIVWINGEKLSKHSIFFSDLRVDMAIDRADIFSFSIVDAINMEFELKNSELFEFGNTVEIHIGYADNTQSKSTLPILFKGVITSVRWNFSENNYMDITVEGKDFSFLLMKHKSSDNGKQLTWNKMKDSEIVNKIINSTYGDLFSEIHIDTTKQRHHQVYYQEDNDYNFVNNLAKKNGCEFFIQHDVFYFRQAPAIDKATNDDITLSYGKEILSFSPEFNVEKEVTKVKVVGIEFQNAKEKIVGEAPKSSFSGTLSSDVTIKELLKNISNIEHEIKAPVNSVEDANILAQAKYDELSSNLIKGELVSVGIPELKPGMYIQLKGFGTRFSTTYYISKAVHIFNNKGYEVRLSVKSNPNFFKKGKQ